MRGLLFCIIAVAFVCAYEFDYESVVITKDTPVDGTLEKGEIATYLLTDVSDWRIVSMGFKAYTSKPDFFTEVASVVVECGEHKFEAKMVDGLASVHYSAGAYCETGNSTITITNTSEEDITYWGIAADQDRYQYALLDNGINYGYVPGKLTSEFVSYRAYIGKSTSGSGAIDVVNVTVNYDTFSGTKLSGFVASETPRPTSRLGVDMEAVDDGLFLAIDRNSKLFCEDCYLYIVLMTQEAKNEPVFFNVQWSVDRGIVRLKDNEIYNGSVIPDNHGQHFMVDLRQDQYDSDLYLGFQKENCYNTTLHVDVALTSFDDGKWDTCKSTTLEGVGLREWGIHQRDECHTVSGVYYIRIWSDAQSTETCNFGIVYRITRSPATQLYQGKQVGYTSKAKKIGITYYRVNIPKEEFVDVTSVTISMKEVFYTSAGSFWYGFDVFYGPETDPVHILNPLDKATYVYTSTINYRREVEFTVTEGQEGFCTDCVYAFAARTTNETTWVITAELGYTPYLLKPNEAKKGTLKGYTGPIESSIYLSQSEYRPVEIACLKLKEDDPNLVLYVSTKPHPSHDNHSWRDSTAADNRAEIELMHDHPDFCTDCYYYISVYYMDESAVDANVDIEVSFNCPDGVCKSCEDGYDPAKQCSDCLPGYFGPNCQKCQPCNHGTCESGKTGSGKCVCNEGWGPADTCTECLEGYWGVDCQACPSCNGHGKCNSGLHGDGKCKCNTNFDDRTNCEDCKSGYFGQTCEGKCPANDKGICGGNGQCADKMAGNGRCACKEGFVGIKCDTTYENDRCSPHCIVNRGACDEENGVCVCYDDFTGVDCGKEAVNIWIYVSIGLMSSIFLVVFIVAAKKMHCSLPARKGRKGEREPMIGKV